MTQAELEQVLAAAIAPIADLVAGLERSVADVQREQLQSEHRIERASDQTRLQIADALLELQRRCAELRDGRDGIDGVGIRTISLAADGATLTFECTDDSRFECPLIAGSPGQPGPAGVGVDAPCWQGGVHREGVVVQHFEGRIYRALKDNAEEPGDSQAWARIGRLGSRWCGPFEEHRTYEAGDLYVKGGTFQVLANGEHRCLAPKPLTPSEVRTIARKHCEERELALRSELATQAELKRTQEDLERARAELTQEREASAGLRRDVDALTRSVIALRAAVEDLAARGPT